FKDNEIITFYESNKELDCLKDFLGAKIPAYMIPRKFFHVKKLPQNPNGKIDRKALKQKLE
ncbi:amino acid adenylation protein, partial [Campylobacter sp. 34484-21]|nr:amino acid adenylation protein [Campylobacter magnus]